MKKYFYIYKTSFIEAITYIPSILFKFVSFFVMMFILFSLWKYIYSDPSQVINNFSLIQMIWYILITEALWYGQSITLSKEIIKDVKTGNIATNLNKPYNYVMYIISKHFASGTIRLLMFLIVITIIGFLFVGGIDTFKIMYLPLMIISILLGYIINTLIKVTLSLLAFWMEDPNPLFWVYNKILLIFGIFLPIDMFPKVIQNVLGYSPVYVTMYGPAKLIIDFNFTTFISVIGFQLIYLLILILLIRKIYKKGEVKLNVNGG